jgi:hypothetical protein
MDKKIRSLVFILNSRGIRTTGSCEGHIDHGAPAPWVKVTPSAKTSRPILRKISRYLDEFYVDRTVPDDVHLVVQKAHSGFWIHNGGEAYDRWRAFVNECVEKIKRGEKMQSYIDSRERGRRSKRLALYQKEMKRFAQFLKAVRR